MSVHVILASYQSCVCSNVYIDYCNYMCDAVVYSKGQGCTTVEVSIGYIYIYNLHTQYKYLKVNRLGRGIQDIEH